MADRKPITDAQRRAKNAERAKCVRDARIANGLCMTCGAEAALDPATRLPKRQCLKHLRAEAMRKAAVRGESSKQRETRPDARRRVARALRGEAFSATKSLKARLKAAKSQRFTDRPVELEWL